MHFFNQVFNYDHPWSHVVIGMWHKYPNPKCSHVVSIDVLDRSVDPVTGIIRTERVLGCKQKAPGWILKMFGGSEDAYVREISFIDPKNQRASISSVNMSLNNVAQCLESVEYRPASQTHTSFFQTAEITARMALWRSVADGVERWMLQRFQDNAALGKLAFTDVLRNLWEERNLQAVAA
ncbi:PRELI-like family-domain-containing protein [Mucidula mucida]|nr:PRELI-like family-domain-containing protein [Mucidula mucida]